MKRGREKTESSITLFAGMETRTPAYGRRRDPSGDLSTQSDASEQPVKAPASVISSTINRLKKNVEQSRISYIKRRMEANNKKLHAYTGELFELGKRCDTQKAGAKNCLMTQIEKAKCSVFGLEQSSLEKDEELIQEEGSIMFSACNGGNLGKQNDVNLVKLPAVQQYPPYTTWIFLDRNQKMPEDQSVVGRRRIYYDQNGSEALICSDSEEETAEEEDEKHEFSKGEDYILWHTIEELGGDEPILKALANCMDAEVSEIQARYETLKKDGFVKENALRSGLCVEVQKSGGSLVAKETMGRTELEKQGKEENAVTEDKDLNAAMDSFDNLFCRRCLVFDCRLHGCSQKVIQSSDKQLPCVIVDGSTAPCGLDCYMMDIHGGDKEKYKVLETAANEVWSYLLERKVSSMPSSITVDKKDDERTRVPDVKVESHDDVQRVETSKKGRKPKKSPKRRAEEVLVNIRKKQNKVVAGDLDPGAHGTEKQSKSRDGPRVPGKKADTTSQRFLKKHDFNVRETKDNDKKSSDAEMSSKCEGQNDKNLMDSGNVSNAGTQLLMGIDSKWSKLEKGLYEKGLEIFGRNSCLIARNMLKGMKTCREVAECIMQQDLATKCRSGDCHNLYLHGNGKNAEHDATMDLDSRSRTRLWRKRGRVRRLKYTWKSAGHPAIRKRIVDSKDQPCKQYTPCSCKFSCGKTCDCLHNGTCCEKYCGCSKSCKNRFRGCHCAKSQCRSRQCPCFAAGRECDPDVCRNCWVGCGDGTLGGPPQRGDNYECQNMKLLLRQQQRVLLGRSDVAGWGAFLKNSVSRHDYLGEYTGELISHREADKRGKIYDRENSSFLFNLNDQFVLDAYRKGDKLKFANHSPNPNCYAKVIMVAGDHRVGIFAKDRISAGEELFYDYRYEADRAPVWARKPEGPTNKREDQSATSGRAQKVA
ncbi:hypothetical protein KP509_09G065000 [Ceratopteris richardii]|uniref:Uncharacterized protein n=1 Tax=Ceratopteris richardii TaxID=49495 RepID=A0A8T2U847_CERRI|nr:hypothetical protein KP509_09G065000 [Ceratopteris richardii]